MSPLNNNMYEVYYEKYIKYKNKYLQLKQLQLMGGAQSYFPNDCTFYIMASINKKSQIQNNFSNRIQRFTKTIPSGSNLHITLLTLHLNKNHPNFNIFYSTNFLNDAVKLYKNIFQNEYLESKTGNYDSFGKSQSFFNITPSNLAQIKKNKESKFFVRKYKLPNGKENLITEFRTNFYKLLNAHLNILTNSNQKFVIKKIPNNPQNIAIEVSYNNIPLYAVTTHYFGKGVWEPHISLFSNIDFYNNNQALYSQFQNMLSQNQMNENILMTNYLQGVGGNVNQINLINDIDEIIFSYSNPRSEINIKI